ncbi:ABC transporter permease [Amycolatopsis jejuensis]|uniref:ABC transporter permease n=1 Tax=Amycolatopsis jejuensis TaxID=330084 RepID=UPI000524BEAD|nr:ABC transporter permease [Amycolatopsis jejuensis]
MKKLLSVWISTPLLLLAFLALWQLYVSAFDVSRFVLPSPAAVFDAVLSLLRTPGTYHHAYVTGYEIVIGFLIAIVTGVGIGTLLAKIPSLERIITPFVVAIQVTPKTPFVPLFIVWFGFGLTSKIVIAALLAFFPIFSNTVLGVKAVPEGLRDVATVLQMSKVARFRRLEFPHALPYVLTGMEVGMVLAIIGAIVGEFLAGNQGLGYLAIAAMNALRIQELFGVMVLLTILGFLLHLAIVSVKRFAIPWHESQQLAIQSA